MAGEKTDLPWLSWSVMTRWIGRRSLSFQGYLGGCAIMSDNFRFLTSLGYGFCREMGWIVLRRPVQVFFLA